MWAIDNLDGMAFGCDGVFGCEGEEECGRCSLELDGFGWLETNSIYPQ